MLGLELLYMSNKTGKKKVRIVYILPSNYDDSGYPFRFWKGLLPSNTLICMRTLTEHIVQSGKLGNEYSVNVEIIDEHVQRVDVEKIVRKSKKKKETLIVGFVGVQTNMFTRAVDLALSFRSYKIPVMIGGFHVSGVIKLFGGLTDELQFLANQGIILVAGEVEDLDKFASILRDILENQAKQYYVIDNPPEIKNSPVAMADRSYLKRFMQPMCTIDTSRGCPYNCSFCTIIHVQGRKIRCRSVEKILEVIEKNYDAGFYSYFFTDDNLSRSPIWRDLFEGLIRLREKGKKIRFMMQVDTAAWKIPKFVDLASQAGCYLVFVGMESVNPKNLMSAGKTQNNVEEYRKMVDAWHQANILVHVGYIIGLPYDTPESVSADVEVLKSDIKVDEASFFIMTPLPGSKDHKDRVERGDGLDPDWNNYDSCHETFTHPNFSRGALKKSWMRAWEQFYEKSNIISILLRCSPEQYWNAFWLTLWNRYSTLLGQHPMNMGFIRRKSRKERRSSMPKEELIPFFRRRLNDFYEQAKAIFYVFLEYQEIWLLTRKSLRTKRDMLARIYSQFQDIHSNLVKGIQETPVNEFLRTKIHQFHLQLEEMLKEWMFYTSSLNKRTKEKWDTQVKVICNYLNSIRERVTTIDELLGMEKSLMCSILQFCEETMVKSVGRRRKMNQWWQEWFLGWSRGKIDIMRIFSLPSVLFFEVYYGLRFAISAVRMK